MADQSGGAGGGGGAVVASGGGGLMREYRKGNWTLQETMVLIEAKKMDDERRLKRASCSSSEQQEVTGSQEMLMMIRNKPAELRWKWVEDYCWRRGCFRSQNQCNDKWDNLMRDYKKVRDHERKLAEQNAAAGTSSSSSLGGSVSYWNMDKSERKERSLPSNMSTTIYEALVDVVEKKVGGSSSAAALSPATAVVNTSGTPTPTDVLQAATPTIMPPTAAISLLHQQHLNASVATLGLPLPEIAGVAPLPLPPPLPSAQPNIPICQPATTTIRDSSDSDTSSDSPAKRRRKDKGPETGGGPPSSRNEAAGVANAISKGASKITEAIQASESRRDERHREMLGLKQRRLQIEEARMEVNRQGMSGLAEAINNIANSIMALAASNNNHGQATTTPPPPPPPP